VALCFLAARAANDGDRARKGEQHAPAPPRFLTPLRFPPRAAAATPTNQPPPIKTPPIKTPAAHPATDQNQKPKTDNVGDNVGDIAGMGADLFGSFAESTCAALVVAAVSSLGTGHSWPAMMFPLLVSAAGILVCLVTTLLATDLKPAATIPEIEPALKAQLVVATVLMTPVALALALGALPATFELPVPSADPTRTFDIKVVKNWYMFVCVAAGLWGGLVIGLQTEYFTSNAYKPVQDVADSCRTGAFSLFFLFFGGGGGFAFAGAFHPFRRLGLLLGLPASPPLSFARGDRRPSPPHTPPSLPPSSSRRSRLETPTPQTTKQQKTTTTTHNERRTQKTKTNHKPNRKQQHINCTGAATDIIFGLALGYKSAIVPCFVIAIAIYVGNSLAGMLGIACCALGMLATLSTGLAIDAYG